MESHLLPVFQAVVGAACHTLQQWLLTLGNPDFLGLQLPQAFTTSWISQGFWELLSKNTWVTKGWKPLLYRIKLEEGLLASPILPPQVSVFCFC